MTRFRVLPVFLSAILFWAGPLLAEEPTPLDVSLPAGEIALIAAPVPAAESQDSGPVQLTHYRLLLPTDYNETGDQMYPVMFIASPNGNAGLGEMGDVLMRDRWIVAMLVESRNGSHDWLPNFMATYDDLVQRVRVQPEMLFCTGLSGAAKVCSVYPGIRPGFRGMILQAAGPWGGRVFSEPGNEDLLVYGTFGTFDGNFHHARRIRMGLPGSVRRMITIWDGGHAWAPRAVFETALRWVERAALLESAYDPALHDAYRWYAENRLADFAQASGEIEGFATLEGVRALPREWRDAADPDLGDRIDAAFASAPTPPDTEVAAHNAYRHALGEDERDHGRNPATIAAAYQAIADQYPDTVYGVMAAARGKAVMWETGRYP